MELLEAGLVESPADETELLWVDAQEQAVATHNGDLSVDPGRQTTLFVRVLERGRLGTFRTGASTTGEIANGIRQALAQSKTRDTVQGLAHFPADEPLSANKADLFDPRVTELDPDRARKLMRQQLARKESGRLDWGRTNVLVANSRGLRREIETTDCSFQVRCGRGPGAGRAASSSRTLQGLDAEAIRDRARARHGGGASADPPRDRASVVLAPEATIRLIELLQQIAFSASSYHDGLSFLREHLGVQVFDRRINLRDDGTDSSGLPFPFDFEGTPKRPVDLIVNGTPKTPALDQRQAALLGLPPTGHAIAGNDALAQNLFLQAGEDSHQEMLEAASGGIFIGWLDRVECFDPARVRFRARASSVRRIENAELAEPIPDLVWEDSVLRAFSSLAGLGSETVIWSPTGSAGAFATPALSLAEVPGLGKA